MSFLLVFTLMLSLSRVVFMNKRSFNKVQFNTVTQMFPMALICGNTSLMKPSERDPGATMMLAQMAQDAGFPDGTINIIHGAHDCLFEFYFFLVVIS